MPSHHSRSHESVRRSLPTVSHARYERRSSNTRVSMRSTRRTLPIVRIGSLLFVAVLLYVVFHGSSSAHVDAEKAAPVSKSSQVNQQQVTAFQQTITQIQTAHPTVAMSVAVASEHGSVRTFGDQNTFDGASTAKLLTAADYLHHVEQHTASLHQTISGKTAEAWLQSMIVASDDQAWTVLNNYLGHRDLARYATSIGFTQYHPDTNSLTAADIALLLQKLYQGTLLQSSHRQLLLSYMSKANYREYIVAGAPRDATVYHKIGIDEDYVNDAAIIDRNGQWQVLVIYTNGHGTYDWQQRASLMQQITQAAHGISE